MSLLFNMLSRLVITFLPRSKGLLISWLQSPPTMIMEPKKIKSAHLFAHLVSPHLFAIKGPDAMILIFWMLSFKPVFHSPLSPSSKGSLILLHTLSAIRMLSSAYLRLPIFLPAILIPACASSSLAFCKTYSACKLNGKVTICSLMYTFSQFWTSPLFHVQLLLDLHRAFSKNVLHSGFI